MNSKSTSYRKGIPDFLGRILNPDGLAVGTCFQAVPGVIVTAWHVLHQLDSGHPGAQVSVDGLQETTQARLARVVRVDPACDLAVLRCDEPLPGTVTAWLATDAVQLLTDVVVTGVSLVDDPGHEYRYLDATGTWQGRAIRDGQLALGRLTSSSLVPGMSGAPVLRLRDQAVAGVVSARYNSADGWMRDSVWVARIEDLAELLGETDGVSVRRQIAVDDEVKVILSVSAERPYTSLSSSDSAPSTANGPREAAHEAAKVLAALDDSARGLGPLADVCVALITAATRIGQHTDPEQRDFRRRVQKRGLAPRVLIRRLPGHEEAIQAWAAPLDPEESKPVNSQGMLTSFVQEFRTELTGELFAGLSKACRVFLRDALTDEATIPLSSFLSALEKNLPTRWSTSREIMLLSAAVESGSAGEKTEGSWNYHQLGLSAVAEQMCALPDTDPYTLGRESLIADVAHAVNAAMRKNQAATAFLSGQPGVGTSTVAIEAARQLIPEFPGGVVYIDLHGLIPGAQRDPRTVVRLVSEAMKLDLGPGAMDDERMFAAFSSRLKGRRVLLVLDNAADAAHVAKFARAPTDCGVIITSRDRLQDYASPGLVFRVEALARETSIKVLEKFAEGHNYEGSQLNSLAHLCDDVPLALRMIAARIVSRPEMDLGYLIYLLREEVTRLDYLEAGERAVRATIRLSYDNLDLPTRRVLRLMTAVPGLMVTGKELHHCLGDSPFQQERMLNRLVDRSLAQQQVVRTFAGSLIATFTLFQLVRLFGRERLDAEDAKSLIHEFQHQYVAYLRERLREILDHASDAELSGELDPARFHAAERLAEQQNWLDLAKGLAVDLHVLYLSRHELNSVLAVHDILVALHLRSGEYEEGVNACLTNASNLADLGVNAEALTSARRARQIASEHGLLMLVAKADFRISVLLGKQKNWRSALEAGERSSSALIKLDYEAAAIPVAINNCMLAQKIDATEKALEWGRIATDLANRFGDTGQQADATFERAQAENGAGHHLAAIEIARRSAPLWKATGNWWNAAISYQNGALYAKQMGDISTASELLSLGADSWEQDKKPKSFPHLLITLVDLSAVQVEAESFEQANFTLGRADKLIRQRAASFPALMRLEALVRVSAIRLFVESPAPPGNQLQISQPEPGSISGADDERQSDPEVNRVLAVLKQHDAGELNVRSARDEVFPLLAASMRNLPEQEPFWLHEELGEMNRGLGPGSLAEINNI